MHKYSAHVVSPAIWKIWEPHICDGGSWWRQIEPYLCRLIRELFTIVTLILSVSGASCYQVSEQRQTSKWNSGIFKRSLCSTEYRQWKHCSTLRCCYQQRQRIDVGKFDMNKHIHWYINDKTSNGCWWKSVVVYNLFLFEILKLKRNDCQEGYEIQNTKQRYQYGKLSGKVEHLFEIYFWKMGLNKLGYN